LIQQAIDEASIGDVVEVQGGFYQEEVNINKSMILRGVDDGEGKPVISSTDSAGTIKISADNVILEGFLIMNANTGILMHSNNSILRNNTLNSTGDFGIQVINSNNNTVSNNTICNKNKGFYFESTSSNVITKNYISNCFECIELRNSEVTIKPTFRVLKLEVLNFSL